jgi:hypothetical protein
MAELARVAFWFASPHGILIILVAVIGVGYWRHRRQMRKLHDPKGPAGE